MQSGSHYVLYSLGIAFFLIGCGPPPNAKSLGSDTSSVPTAPVLTYFTYIKSGSTMTENAPFLTPRNIFPDLGTGTCTSIVNFAEVIINGTIDEVNTDHLVLTGPTSQEITISGSTFSIKACIAVGSTLLKLTAENAANQASAAIKISINNYPALKTLAFGHPNYPDPGFRTSGIRTKTTSLSSGAIKARQISAVEVGHQSITSTGNTGYTLETGFTNIVKQAGP